MPITRDQSEQAEQLFGVRAKNGTFIYESELHAPADTGQKRTCSVCSNGPAKRDGLMRLMNGERGPAVWVCDNIYDDKCGFCFPVGLSEEMIEFFVKWRIQYLLEVNTTLN